jgi:hypothetical protein
LGALHIYSFHASTSHVAYVLMQHMIMALLRSWDHLKSCGCHLTRYAVTEDGVELSIKMGLREVFKDPLEHRGAKTEVIPEFREGRTGSEELDWMYRYHRRVRT